MACNLTDKEIITLITEIARLRDEVKRLERLCDFYRNNRQVDCKNKGGKK